jgi:membrane fusion protein, multidrug efflux system
MTRLNSSRGAGTLPAALALLPAQASEARLSRLKAVPRGDPRANCPPSVVALIAAVVPLWAQTVDLVPVVSKPVSRTVDLPAEIQPYLAVSLHARVPGYVERVLVDRGSVVKQGDLLAELSAPELQSQSAEAESKVQAAESEKLEAEAQLAAAESTYDRLRKAAETPGAVAGNDVIQSQKQVEAAQAQVRARDQARRAAAAAVRALEDMQAYLKIGAPFDGVVTDRFVHPGALVGPGADPVLLVIQQISHLRLVVPVPEEDVGGTVRGASIPFHVPAYPDRTYTGTVARIAHALDPKTRAMPVELDVLNRDGTLAPGMYPSVKWLVRREHPALFVPRTSVVTTTERTFVIRARNGRAEWVDVKKGAADGDLIEVSGALAAGDRVVRRGTDELREGMPLGGK